MPRLLPIVLLLSLAGQAAAADLSLQRIILSSGGVGYFEYTAADVDGAASLGLDVPLDQVDDILMSLVVFDRSGGVAEVTLCGRDTTTQAFGNAPLSPEALRSPTAYLNALRGTQVTVQGARPMTGEIVNAEPVTETTDKTTTQRTRVTLLGTDGLRQFVLEDADTVQVADPDLRAQIQRALEALRTERALASRHLTIRLTGTGKRTVAIGYVAAAPLWKPTYRLMLAAGAARLQGWATLENQSGSDWKDVTLTLQYGNPVTFRQALYRSYFVQRPEVPLEILGHTLPDIDTTARPMQLSAAAPAAMPRAASMPAPAPMAPNMAEPAEATLAQETAEETFFTVARPVNLAAGHSANIPIIDRPFPATRIGLVPFQQSHPLAAVRLTNDDASSLPAGVLTVYDTATGATTFAGDARLGGLPFGGMRLLPYARDLRTTVETSQSPQPDTITAFSVADGILAYTVLTRQVIAITATAPAHEARDLLLEIPKSDSDQTLTLDDGKPPAAEQTATAFRIQLALTPGETRTVTARLDEPQHQTIALIDGDHTVLQLIIGAQNLNPTGRDALRHLLDLRLDQARKADGVDRQHKRLDDVLADEDRIRKNLVAVAPTDAFHARLTRALDADETTIEELRKSIADAATELAKAQRDLADAVTALHL